jgi:hypothetical protein
MMVHSRGSSFLVVALAFLLVGAACGLDVIKTTQGWEGGMLPKASNLEELVVRVGLTAPAFSVDTLYHPFLSFFYYPYTEWNMESDFLVRHNKPVVVYKYGVIDRTGQITTADLSVSVAASLRGYETVDKEAGFMYHLQLSYECLDKEEDVSKYVVVHLRSSPQMTNEEEEAMFVFKKHCRAPQRHHQPSQGSSFFVWTILSSGSSLSLWTSSDETRVEGGGGGSASGAGGSVVMIIEQQEIPDTNSNRKHRPMQPKESEDAPQPPAWFSSLVSIIGTATFVGVVVLLLEAICEVWERRENSSDEENADEQEVEPLLEESEEAQQLSTSPHQETAELS